MRWNHILGVSTVFDPGGITEISRWLSAAIPPALTTTDFSTPEGSQKPQLL